MKICYILGYRDPKYIRTRTLLRAIDDAEGVEAFQAINTDGGLWRYLQAFISFLRIKHKHDPDCFMIGFRGHEIFWFIRILAGKKPIIFDALMSPYAALAEERKKGNVGLMLSGFVWWIERSILKNANLILTDTTLHRYYFARKFNVKPEKIIPVPVGALEGVIVRDAIYQKREHVFKVLFYGSFLPLHGVDVILRAAARLKHLSIRFDFIGGKEENIKKLYSQCAILGIKNFTHRKWVHFEKLLGEEIPKTDICLGGPFGNTPQAKRVVTGKTCQCLAMGKATVIGAIYAEYGFADKENCLIVRQGDHSELEDALRWAFTNRDKLRSIGERGRELYNRQFSTKAAQSIMQKCLSSLNI